MYGLHPLMPTKYIVPLVGGNERDNISVRVLTSKITKLEKLLEDKTQTAESTRIQQWNKALWNQQKNLEKQFSLGDLCLMVLKMQEVTPREVYQKMVWIVQNIVCVAK